ncbi:DUF4347 domain-containing protein, partial [Mesorhizobium sp. M0488]
MKMPSSISEIAFIDCGIGDATKLAGSLRPDVKSVILTQASGALEQVQLALANQTGLKAIHILAHGSSGKILFTSGTAEADDLAARPLLTASLRSALASDGVLQFWCCETGKGPGGDDFVRAIQRLIGRAVAAASGLVGAHALGGSWTLDRLTSCATFDSPLLKSAQLTYSKVLATNSATTGTDNISQTGGGDTLLVSATNQIQAADYFNGANGSDIILISALAGGAIDLSAAGSDASHGFHNYESLAFNNTSGTTTAIFNSSQFSTSLLSTSLAVTGTAANQAITINNASFFSAALWTFSSWTSGVDTITINGTSGSDTLTGSIKADIINAGAGADNINAGGDNDTINIGTGQFVAGESIDGGTGAGDSLNFTSTGDGTSVDLSVGTVSNVETLAAINQGSGNGYDQTFTVSATQWDGFTT